MTDQAPREPTSEAPPATPAGWYPTPSGKQRYWDGIEWTDLPSPEDAAEAESEESAAAVAPVARERRRPRWRTLVILGVILLALALGGVAWGVKSSADAAVAHAAVVAKKHAAQVAAQNAAEAKAIAVAAERAQREAKIPQIEDSVKALATKDVADGILDGPVLDSTCTAVGGGSTSALDGASTVFACFVGTVKNADGTETGYNFNATMNWSTGNYTYGLGKASS